mgnify:CR=1 FL=1
MVVGHAVPLASGNDAPTQVKEDDIQTTLPADAVMTTLFAHEAGHIKYHRLISKPLADSF